MFNNLPKEIVEKMNDLMERGFLTPTLALHMTGMGKKNEQEIIDKITDDYSQFSPQSVPLSADPIKDASDRFLAMTNFNMSTLAGISPAMRLLNEELQFTTMPAFSMAQNLVSGYSAMVVAGLTEAEQVKYEYGGLVNTLNTGLTIHFVMGMLSGESATGSTVLSRASQMLSKTAVGQAGKAVAGALMSKIRNLVIYQAINKAVSAVMSWLGRAYAARWLVAAGTGPKGWVLAAVITGLIEAGRYAWHLLGQRIGAERATNLSLQKAAVALFDKQKIVDEFVEYQGVFQGIPGYDNKPYELLDRMLENNSYYGVSPSAFGSSYSDARQISNQLASTSDSGAELPEYVSRVMAIQGILGVSDPTTISSTFSNIIRANPNYSADIEEATLAFERFFMALVGDGQVHLSLLGVAQALSDFSLNYSASTKFVIGSENNVARIAKFMDSASGKLSAAPTVAVTQSIDEVLLAGAFGDNWGALNFMQNHGISQFEGVEGVTGDADTFEKFISGLARESGVGFDSFDAEGGLLDTKQGMTLVRTLTGVFGMEGQGLSAVVAAVRAYVQGTRVTDVHTEYMETRATTTAGIAAENDGYALKKGLVDGDIALSKAIADNATWLDDMGQNLMDAYIQGFPNAMARAGNMIGEVMALVTGKKDYKPPLIIDLPLPFTSFEFNPRPSGNVNPYGSRNLDTRYSNDSLVSESSRDILNTMFGAMGAGSTVRVTGVSGLGYDHDPTRTNVGFDIAIDSSEIYSPFNQDVEVVYVGRRVTRGTGENSYGNSVVLRLPDGSLVSFSHLATASLLQVGQKLSPGQFVGLQGSTGTATGPHVDIEVYGPGSFVEAERNRINGSIISNPNQVANTVGRFVGDSPTEYEFTPVDIEDNQEYNEYLDDSSSLRMEFNIEISGLHRLENVAHSIRRAFA